MSEKKPNIIEREIDTDTYIIYGKMRNWKTMLACCIALKWQKRIYANVPIFLNGKKISKDINSIEQVQKIGFSWEPWVIILDESWINFSWRGAMTKGNRALSEVLWLVGKKNCSLIWIAQRFDGIDTNARRVVDYIFKVKKIQHYNYHSTFRITRERQVTDNRLQQLNSFHFDWIQWMKLAGMQYEQLAQSKLQTSPVEDDEGEEDENEYIWVTINPWKKEQ